MTSTDSQLPDTSAGMDSLNLQQAVGYVAGTRRTLRWVSLNSLIWIHAEDICNALGWQRPGQTLRAVHTHVAIAA